MKYNNITKEYYVMNTTGPNMITNISKSIISNPTNYIKILPTDQFNFCDYCNICKPSKTKKLCVDLIIEIK